MGFTFKWCHYISFHLQYCYETYGAPPPDYDYETYGAPPYGPPYGPPLPPNYNASNLNYDASDYDNIYGPQLPPSPGVYFY